MQDRFAGKGEADVVSALRLIGRIILWALAAVGALFVLGIALAVLSWFWLPGLDLRQLPDTMVIEFNTADGVVEKRSVSPLAWATESNMIALPDLVRGLDAAARDPRVKGVVARLGNGGLGLAQAQEIRDAVLAFRKEGKFAVAFAETFGEMGDPNIHYYLATAFDSIYIQPSGSVDIYGFRLENPFLSEALAEIGVSAEMDRRAEYKSALEIFTEPGLTEPSRQNLQRLVDNWAQQIADGIAATRPGFTPADARELIDRGPYLAMEAMRRGLVDGLLYWSDVAKEVDTRSGGSSWVHLNDYVDALPPSPGDAPVIALIHGLGPVTLAASKDEPWFGEVSMASDTVAGALRTAIDDPKVAAILFRIDSPGGSYVAADTIWAEVRRAREVGKPVVVSMGNTAASGGYFVAAAADSIVAQPATVTGSIGVFGGKFVLSGLWERLGINWDGVQAGANAGMNSPNESYTEAGWAHLQRSLDRIYADFTNKVAEGRDLPPDRVEAVARGQVWTGQDAREHGLVDELGGYATAIARARTAAGIDAGAAVRLEPYPKPRPLDRLLRDLIGRGMVDQQTEARLAVLARLAAVLEPFAEALEPALGSPGGELRMPEIRPVQ